MPVTTPTFPNDNVIRDVTAGFNMGNELFQRQQRAQQLQSQMALNAVHERLLAQQADQIAQNVQIAAAQHQKDVQDRAVYEAMGPIMAQGAPQDLSPEDAQMYQGMLNKARDEWLVQRNPKVAMQVAQARNAFVKPQTELEKAQIGAQSREQVAQTRLEGQKYTADHRLAGVQQKLQSAGVSKEASGAFAQNYLNYQTQMEDAMENGDEKAYREGKEGMDLMMQHLNRTHPQAAKTLQGQYLKTKAIKAYSNWLDSGGKDKALETEWRGLEGEIKQNAAEGDGGATTPVAAPASAPAPAASVKRVKVTDGKNEYTIPDTASQRELAKKKGLRVIGE